jgi:hypothetical protein
LQDFSQALAYSRWDLTQYVKHLPLFFQPRWKILLHELVYAGIFSAREIAFSL